MGCFVMTLPILLWLSIIIHRRRRAAKLRRQIQMLNSQWHSTTEIRY